MKIVAQMCAHMSNRNISPKIKIKRWNQRQSWRY